MDELVLRLSQGDHPVDVDLRPERTVGVLKERIDEYGFLHLKFTDTEGGTVIGVRIDPDESDFGSADFDHGTGTVVVSGRLKLNYVPVKCVATIDLETLQGHGHLDVVDDQSP